MISKSEKGEKHLHESDDNPKIISPNDGKTETQYSTFSINSIIQHVHTIGSRKYQMELVKSLQVQKLMQKLSGFFLASRAPSSLISSSRIKNQTILSVQSFLKTWNSCMSPLVSVETCLSLRNSLTITLSTSSLLSGMLRMKSSRRAALQDRAITATRSKKKRFSCMVITLQSQRNLWLYIYDCISVRSHRSTESTRKAQPHPKTSIRSPKLPLFNGKGWEAGNIIRMQSYNRIMGDKITQQIFINFGHSLQPPRLNPDPSSCVGAGRGSGGNKWMLEAEGADKSEQKVLEYFNTLFSPKLFAESLIKHNQDLQLRCLQNSDSEPEQIYMRRAKRVKSLQQKQNKNLNILEEIRRKDINKFNALAEFMKLFGLVKQKIGNLRHDCYSEKTFQTLKKLSSNQLLETTKVLSSILSSAMNLAPSTSRPVKGVDERFLEFLIIPRFFVSREKIMKLVCNPIIQEHFTMLIFYGCLGHYNNEANKKLPENPQMLFVKNLLQEEDGRERFKKICTINHGGKFFKKHPDQYYQLYTKSMDTLKAIDLICKRKYQDPQILKEFNREETLEIQNVSQKERSIEQRQCSEKQVHFFLPIPKENSFHCKKSPLPMQFCEIESVSNLMSTFCREEPEDLKQSVQTKRQSECPVFEVTRSKVRRFHSLIPIQEEDNVKNRLKKSFTLEMGREPNIILVLPPGKQCQSQI